MRKLIKEEQTAPNIVIKTYEVVDEHGNKKFVRENTPKEEIKKLFNRANTAYEFDRDSSERSPNERDTV